MGRRPRTSSEGAAAATAPPGSGSRPPGPTPAPRAPDGPRRRPPSGRGAAALDEPPQRLLVGRGEPVGALFQDPFEVPDAVPDLLPCAEQLGGQPGHHPHGPLLSGSLVLR